MQIVLAVWSTDSDRALGFDYAVVEGRETLLSLALRRINLLREQKPLNSTLDEIRYWDLSAQYFNLSIDHQSQVDEETCSELADRLTLSKLTSEKR